MEDHFTGLAYAALLGETTWRDFLRKFALTIPDGTAGLIVHDRHNGEGYGIFSGNAEKAVGQYNSYYAKLNPLQSSLALKAFGEPAYDDELYPRSDLVQTEFFNDFLVPHELTHSAGVKIAEVDGQSFTLAVGGTHPEPVRRSIATLATVAPHLGRVFGFYGREGRRAEREAQDILGLLETPQVGAIVVSGKRRATSVSKAAQAMLGDAAPLRICADGRVHFRKEAAQALCEQMLRRGYDGPATIDFHSHDVKLTLVSARKSPELLYFEGPTVIVFMVRVDDAPMCFDARRFSDAYGLTKSELRALSGIVKGQSVDQIAVEAGLSRETIRSQTKSLYSKMGSSSAADVLRKVHLSR